MRARNAAQCRARIEEFLDAGAWPVTLYNREPETLIDALIDALVDRP